MRVTLFSRIYRACKEWQGWEGRENFFERMEFVRWMMISTIENGWEVGLGPGRLGYSEMSLDALDGEEPEVPFTA